MDSLTASKTIHRAGAPAGDSRVLGEALPVYTAVTPVGAVTWSDGGAGGSFSPAIGNSTTYTPPNETKSIVITATDSANAKTSTLTVTSSFPLYPDFGYDAPLTENTKVSYAEDDEPVFREKGSVKRKLAVGFLGRTSTDRNLCEAHFAFHRISRLFYVVDDELNVILLVRYDSSEFGLKVVSANSNDMTALFRQA